ncbi:hypothetical protein JHN53_25275 [Streptomyces sp. MBT58]|uniref:hypothetical protein n=1 Tax=Streptomyces sp. MBT58 TaxID=1488389 RepID=UPI001913D835|nr:hypothetical protein [Streptomyces sp. MBT58]MBK5994894.1 hypothetical protein [Streptomyces sp. MBT58]
MAKIDIPQHLIDLESTAWAEQQAGALTLESAAAVQQAITEHAAATPGLSRYQLEAELKRQVRHPELGSNV